ncbi:DUF4864 domain-containing protein [Hoeflea prorocentri]|uniref:DUF4864 domain-containing protein n=1 Tax=Hoeflea prorocentri TaxID=1922333 RepID=A0A9X3ZHF0_9HYPH|nr:DUF4864 domain-containing protein [Hoeflea prorocentri]MCY6380833.1 DUF4864 domain-containing protein [Hoeflea prorocentri]MDA5398633.1 DUF4864 domain-containing protein [Hoeflea prorocentri]
MRILGLSIIAGLLMVTSSIANDEMDVASARGIVEQQITAFLSDDIDTAYSFAAPAIKRLYPEPQRFLEMVKRNYQPVYRPGNYAFGRALSDTDGDTIALELLITGPKGKDWRAIYVLNRQDNGKFQISGVQLTKLKSPAI